MSPRTGRRARRSSRCSDAHAGMSAWEGVMWVDRGEYKQHGNKHIDVDVYSSLLRLEQVSTAHRNVGTRQVGVHHALFAHILRSDQVEVVLLHGGLATHTTHT